jgi:hypothetical protein
MKNLSPKPREDTLMNIKESKKKTVIPAESRLEAKVMELIESSGIDIPLAKKQALAKQMTEMTWTWLRKPDEERDSYLRRESQKILHRLGLRRSHYSVSIAGHHAEGPESKEQIKAGAIVLIKRVIKGISKRMDERQLSLIAKDFRERPRGCEIDSVETNGRYFEVISTIRFYGTPEGVVRSGVASAERRGKIRISAVKPKGKTPDSIQEELFDSFFA